MGGKDGVAVQGRPFYLSVVAGLAAVGLFNVCAMFVKRLIETHLHIMDFGPTVIELRQTFKKGAMAP